MSFYSCGQASDFGPRTSLKIVDNIRDEVRSGKVKMPAEIRSKLKDSIISVLQPQGKGSELQLGGAKTSVIFVIGVNGGGKTTTIGKLAYKLRQEGAKVSFSFKTSSFLQGLRRRQRYWSDRCL